MWGIYKWLVKEAKETWRKSSLCLCSELMYAEFAATMVAKTESILAVKKELEEKKSWKTFAGSMQENT